MFTVLAWNTWERTGELAGFGGVALADRVSALHLIRGVRGTLRSNIPVSGLFKATDRNIKHVLPCHRSRSRYVNSWLAQQTPEQRAVVWNLPGVNNFEAMFGIEQDVPGAVCFQVAGLLLVVSTFQRGRK